MNFPNAAERRQKIAQGRKGVLPKAAKRRERIAQRVSAGV